MKSSYAMDDMEPDQADQSGASDDTPMTEEGQPEAGGAQEVTIPADQLGGRDYSAGDTITLKVVRTDDTGVHAEIQNTSGDEEAPDAGKAIDGMASDSGY